MIARRFDTQLTHMRLGSLPSFCVSIPELDQAAMAEVSNLGGSNAKSDNAAGKVLAPVARLRFINGWLMQDCKRVWVFGPEAIWRGCVGGWMEQVEKQRQVQ